MATLTLTVPDMACEACASTITQAVQAVDNHAVVSADLENKQVQISTTSALEQIKQAIAAAGYSPQ